VVDPARGSGHALEADRRSAMYPWWGPGDSAHLRTRVNPDGMDYKGYNIAVHEMCHNVEQTFSLYAVDDTLLQGVPGKAFTEALAFTCQHRDLELLGLSGPAARTEHARALKAFWDSWEIAGVARDGAAGSLDGARNGETGGGGADAGGYGGGAPGGGRVRTLPDSLLVWSARGRRRESGSPTDLCPFRWSGVARAAAERTASD